MDSNVEKVKEKKINLKELFSNKLAKSIVIGIGFIILMLIFNKLTNNIFTSVRNLTLLMKQGSVLMIVSSGLMLLLISRNFDLSGGAAVYLVCVFVSQLVVVYKMNIWLVLILAMGVGIMMGAFNGFFVGYIGVPAFIGTLAAQLLFKGIGYTWTDAATIGPIPQELANLSEGYIPPVLSTIILITVAIIAILLSVHEYRKMKQWYGGITNLIMRILAILLVCIIGVWVFSGYYGIPMCVLFAAIMVFITGFINNKTVFGRNIYIIGGNPEAAKLSGIKTKRRIFQAYVYMGVIYGVAGIILTARLGGSTATSGNLIELDAVAAACIGGTSMSGGVGTITGVVMGVAILAAVDNVMSLMNVSSYLQMLVKGLILLVSVCMDVYINQSKFKLRKPKTA